MKTLVNNYYGTSGANGTSGGSGGPGVYALNIGAPKTGGGHYLPPGEYATGASVEIEGGAGGSGGYGTMSVNSGNGGGGGGGGVGVLLGGGTLGNSGTILGGAGGAGGYGGYTGVGLYGSPGGAGGAGGVGVDFTSGAKLMNDTGGKITGGAGGAGKGGGSYGGMGGAGGSGGVGVSLGGGTLTNASAITGGAGGGGGPGFPAPEKRNGGGPGNGGAGGGGAAGVTLAGGVLTNTAAITGGAGGYGGVTGGQIGSSAGAGAAGGSGAYLLGGTLTNHGSITGGVGGAGGAGYQEGGGGSGGTGVLLNSGTVITTVSISGGNGGSAADDTVGIISAAGGGGGAGVTELSGTLTNLGSITGGAGGGGGYGYAHSGGAGGSGGAGVSLSGGTLTSSGTVSGGTGGTGGDGNLGLNGEFPATGGAGGNGGAGAYLNGGTLTTSGTISGGAAGAGGTGAPDGAGGAAGDAVQFGSVASALVVEPGAVFNGLVAANTSVNDVLKLSGVQSGGTPITLGTQFTNFSTLAFASGAHWTVDVGTAAAPSGGLAIYGFTTSDTIDVTNLTPAQAQADFTPSSHTLSTASDGTLHFVSGPFSGESFLFSTDGTGTDLTVVVGSALSSVLTSTVTLGSSAHKSPLTISNAGGIAPSVAGANALVSTIATNSLTNHGVIEGAAGSAGSTGGTGGNGAVIDAGTVTNSGSISGGAGGAGTSKGGHGGSGVVLNGGTLITSGTIARGASGSGPTTSAAGDSVLFGTVASTLVVDPGAAFTGLIGGFGLNDTIDVTNLTPAQAVADFNASTHTLTTPSDGTLAFVGHAGDSFLFSNDGAGGTDLTLVVGSALSSVLTSTVTLGGSAHKSPLTISNAGGIAPSTAGAIGLVSTISTNSLTNHGVIEGAAGSTGSTGGTGGNGAVIDAGTVINSGSISGGAGGAGTTKGGHGGSGVVLNGGTLITSGTIACGASGTGPTTSAAGDAVLFGTTASTLVVDPGALSTGQVVANNVHDVLELAGIQSGGTPITLGTQFSTFSMLDFASGAAWTADATLADLIAHPLSIDGFTTADTLTLASLSGAKLSFSTTSDVLTLTKGATTVHLQFDSAFTGDHFVLTANGTAANLTLAAGASAPLAALAHDPRNFVGAEHRSLLSDPSSSGGYSFGRELPMTTAWTAHGLSPDPFTDHGLVATHVMLR